MVDLADLRLVERLLVTRKIVVVEGCIAARAKF